MIEPVIVDNLGAISRAVTAWRRSYEVEPEDKVLDVLARAARDHYLEGYRTSDDLATYLIGTYVGRWSMMINAPTSNSSH